MTSFAKLLEKHEISGMKFGLEMMWQLNAALEDPISKFPSIHIAGTNGKGSVATKMAYTLMANGFRVGLFTSPHLSSFHERITVNGCQIPEERAAAILESIFSFERLEPTFFKALTALAFTYFAEEQVDVAVVEVGMGGRLDATNILTPLLSIVTSIGRDHTQYLGTTCAEIAREKAGIFKTGIPALIGPKAQPYAVFRAVAEENNTPLHVVSGSFAHFEEENQAIAKEAFRYLPFNITEERFSCVPRARFEVFQEDIPIVVDVAHNPPALEALFRRLKQQFPAKRYRALVAFSADKEIASCFDVLQRETSSIHITQAPNPRAAPLEQLAPFSSGCHLEEDLEKAFSQAHGCARRENGVLVICGTFYMMDWIRRRLGA